MGHKVAAAAKDCLNVDVKLVSEEKGTDRKRINDFCQGVLMYERYVLVPAHCVVAAKKLKSTKLEVTGGGTLDLDLKKTFLHPDFRFTSYDKSEAFVHDLALIPVSVQGRQRKRIKRKRGLKNGLTMEERAVELTSDYDCHATGLHPSQSCIRLDDSEVDRPVQGGAGDQQARDPREGYYRKSCWHKSGTPVYSDDSCSPQFMVLVASCNSSRALALDLRPYVTWIENTIITDILSSEVRTPLAKPLLFKYTRLAGKCKTNVFNGLAIHTSTDRWLEPKVIVEEKETKFEPAQENLRVITECGVEVRLKSGMIHSPIHYRNVNSSRELSRLSSSTRSYKYRPNMDCQWLITAPSKAEKVGIKFQYFDLYPDFDRLQIEDGEDTEIALFGADKPTRTIISGSNQLRLKFQTDYQGERRGFSLTFQPIKISECGGEYFAQGGSIMSPNYPFYYPPTTVCVWKITVPGAATVKVEFSVISLHTTETIEFRIQK